MKKGETHTEECVKPRFQSSQTFSVWSVCWPAPLMQLRAKTSHQRMCQSLGIPMPKFPISTVPSSHGSSESGDLVLHLNNCLYNCQHHRHYHHCLQHHDDNGTVIASIVIAINHIARFPRMGSQWDEGEECPPGKSFPSVPTSYWYNLT